MLLHDFQRFKTHGATIRVERELVIDLMELLWTKRAHLYLRCSARDDGACRHSVKSLIELSIHVCHYEIYAGDDRNEICHHEAAANLWNHL